MYIFSIVYFFFGNLQIWNRITDNKERVENVLLVFFIYFYFSINYTYIFCNFKQLLIILIWVTADVANS